jgi:hypothetical protein
MSSIQSVSRRLLILGTLVSWIVAAPAVLRADNLTCVLNPSISNCRGYISVYGYAYDQGLNYIGYRHGEGIAHFPDSETTASDIHYSLVSNIHMAASLACADHGNAVRANGEGIGYLDGSFQEYQCNPADCNVSSAWYCCTEWDINC